MLLNSVHDSILENHKQVLQSQINGEEKTVALETKKIEQLEEEREKVRDEMNTLRSQFASASFAISQETESFKEGLKKFKTKMIIKGVFSLIQGISNLAGTLQKAFKRKKKKRSIREELKGEINQFDINLDSLNDTIIEPQNLTSMTTKSSDLEEILSREKRLIFILTGLAIASAVAGIAKTCVEIHDANVQYERSKAALDTMSKKLSNIDLDQAKSETGFKVIRDETRSIISGKTLNIPGASKFSGAVMRMTHYGEAYVIASKNMQTILNKLVLSRMSKEQSTNMIDEYANWLNLAEQGRLNANNIRRDVVLTLSHRHTELLFNIQRDIMSTFSDHCRSKFYMTFEYCEDRPNWSDSLTEMFTKINKALAENIRQPADFFSVPPSPLKESYRVMDASVGCNGETYDEQNCPISVLKEKNETYFTIPMEDDIFSFNDRIRIDEMRVYLAGLCASPMPSKVQLVIGHPGLMEDRYKEEKFNFVTEPAHYLFGYLTISGTITKAACVSARHSDNVRQMSPFATWYLKVLTPETMDLSCMSSIEIYILGTSIHNTGGFGKRDAGSYEFLTPGFADLTRGCGGD